MSKSLNPLHPTAQHLKRIAISVAASNARCGPPTDLIDDIERAFDGPQPVSHAVPK